MLLDTSFLIDLLRGKDKMAIQRAQELDKMLESKGVASITVMELWRGAMQSLSQEKEKRKVNELLSSLLLYPFNDREAKKAGEIEAELLKQGTMIDLEDIMIAGVAQTHHEPILTRNKKYFSQIRGIHVETY
jgi:tRNA(fMet)-specific endonuclease VapC